MSNHAPFPIVAPKKLIEVAIPLDEINKASAREKSIRHGHPSTLHLWWARRPLAAARAVLFAQLVNDPSWKYSEEELKKPQVKGAITKKRNELFQLIGQLVQTAARITAPLPCTVNKCTPSRATAAVAHDDVGVVAQRHRAGPRLEVEVLGHAVTTGGSRRRNW